PLLLETEAWSRRIQESILGRRLRAGLKHVRRHASADELSAELKSLSEDEADRQYAGYGLVRVIIWAIPILGFLGTVMGITLAIANLSSVSGSLEKSIPQVVGGLSVAFDTTALALGMSMVLMFAQFVVEQAETKTLELVDDRAELELGERFHLQGTQGDPQMLAVRRMIDAVLATTQKITEEQANLWKSTIDDAHQQWNQFAKVQQTQVEESLTNAMGTSLQKHADSLADTELKIARDYQEHSRQLKNALDRTAETFAAGQREHSRQGEVLLQVVQATGEVTKLEDALNRNLAALSGSANFEETLLTLSAVLNVMTARMGVTEEQMKQVQLNRKESESEAA
ncbi:MAG: MotA/TolQ/ExbB proton channel family protein, partial [Planctomycetales bacterium]